MTAVRDQVSSEKDLAGREQDQRAIADAIAALTHSPRPGIGGGVVELGRVTRKLVSIGQHVTVGEQRSAATGKGIIQGARRCPLPSGRVIDNAASTCHQHFAARQQRRRRGVIAWHAGGGCPFSGGRIVEFCRRV